MRHHGQRVVRVGVGVAVAWKMLGRGNDAIALQPFHKSPRLVGYVVAAFAKRPQANHGVSRVAVDVGYGRKIDIDANSVAMSRYFRAHLYNHLVVLNGPQSHLLRKIWHAVEPHSKAPFAVYSHKKRYLRVCLVAVGERGLPHWPALKKNQPPNLVIINELFGLAVIGFVAVGEGGNHEKLPDFLVEGQ